MLTIINIVLRALIYIQDNSKCTYNILKFFKPEVKTT